MICYKDKTFCSEETCAEFGDGEGKCSRSFTTATKDAAIMWWGSEEAPVSMFGERPDCYKEVKNENDK